MHYYHIHGLVFYSDIALPMPSLLEQQAVDVRITWATVEQVPAKLAHQGVGCQWQHDIFDWYLPSVGRITVQNGNAIYIQRASHASIDDVVCFLLGPALAALFIQRDCLVFFGNVLAYDDQHALALLGNGPCSKSTFSWYAERAGLRVLADGLFVVQAKSSSIEVTAGLPLLRLWRDVCERLQLDTDQLKQVRPSLQQYYFPVSDTVQKNYQLTHVFNLQSTRVSSAEMKIEKGLGAFRLLQNHLYGGPWIKGMAKLPVQFAQLTQMAQQVDCQRLIYKKGSYPDDKTLSQLLAIIKSEEVCDVS